MGMDYQSIITLGNNNTDKNGFDNHNQYGDRYIEFVR